MFVAKNTSSLDATIYGKKIKLTVHTISQHKLSRRCFKPLISKPLLESSVEVQPEEQFCK